MSNEAICGSTGLSREELSEYRYQSPGTARTVYAIGSDYFCTFIFLTQYTSNLVLLNRLTLNLKPIL